MKKIVSFEADKARNLKFGINGLVSLEKELGRPLSQMQGENGFALEDLRTIFYVGLKWEDKDLTHEGVGDILDEAIEKNGMEYITKKLGEAIQGSLGSGNALPSAK